MYAYANALVLQTGRRTVVASENWYCCKAVLVCAMALSSRLRTQRHAHGSDGTSRAAGG